MLDLFEKKINYQNKYLTRDTKGKQIRVFAASKTVKVLVEKSDELLSLDGISFEIWQLLDKKVLFQDLIKNLEKRYEVSEKRLKTDVNIFLSELQKYGLLKVLGETKS